MYDPLNSNINETNGSTEPLKNEKNNEAVNNASGETESFQQDYRSMNEQGAAENTAAFEPEAPGTGEQAAAQEPQGTAGVCLRHLRPVYRRRGNLRPGSGRWAH